jgi:hypothetical protein
MAAPHDTWHAGGFNEREGVQYKKKKEVLPVASLTPHFSVITNTDSLPLFLLSWIIAPWS